MKDPLLYLAVISVFLFSIAGFIYRLPESGLIGLTEAVLRFQEKSAGFGSYIFIAPRDIIKETPELSLTQNNSIFNISPPVAVTPQILGALAGGTELEENQSRKEILEYIVEPGDSPWLIAKMANVSLNTILWANDLNHETSLKPGKKLIILPVSGVIHHIKEGETLSEIASRYKAKIDDIIAFNELASETDIFPGDTLIIPDGVIPLKPSAPLVQIQYIPLATSYFICPIGPPCKITQRLHWYNAVDFSHGKCGEPIYAAAAGTVLKVKITDSRSPSAFNRAGNHLTILHPNGIVTFYGHISVALVNPGDHVSQGHIIALVGGQPGTPGAGKSTGCHLHFGVSGARNPFTR